MANYQMANASAFGPLPQQFLTEKRLLQNVTQATLAWYQIAFTHFFRQFPAATTPTVPQLKALVVALREKNVKPITINTYLTAMNSYCRWLHAEGHAPERVKLGKLKVETRVIVVLDEPQMKRLLHFKPRTYREHRTHLALLLALDTGLRLTEMLTLRPEGIDLANGIVKVFGKGQKERLVPFSQLLRQKLYRFQQLQAKKHINGPWLLAGFRGERWESRTATTSLHLLFQKCGVPRCGWHRLRHTFATYYLKHGGDLLRLSMSLGHTRVTTTQHYLHLQTADLSAMHKQVGIFSRIA